jgi:hypothetical protein
MRHLLCPLILALSVSACANKPRGMDALTPEESAELNYYLQKRDECLAQESSRMDDTKSDVNAVNDLVMWKCQPLSRKTASLLYDKFKVDIGSAYAFNTQQEETSRRRVMEAILTNRKMHAGAQASEAAAMQQPRGPMAMPQNSRTPMGAIPTPTPVSPAPVMRPQTMPREGMTQQQAMPQVISPAENQTQMRSVAPQSAPPSVVQGW